MRSADESVPGLSRSSGFDAQAPTRVRGDGSQARGRAGDEGCTRRRCCPVRTRAGVPAPGGAPANGVSFRREVRVWTHARQRRRPREHRQRLCDRSPFSRRARPALRSLLPPPAKGRGARVRTLRLVGRGRSRRIRERSNESVDGFGRHVRELKAVFEAVSSQFGGDIETEIHGDPSALIAIGPPDHAAHLGPSP
jgi:hypothetical protein